MLTALINVLEFHQKMGQTIGDPRSPNTIPDQDFRLSLIAEEYAELLEAIEENQGIEAVAHELGDLCYVVIGAAVTWGIDIAGVFEAIHTSNMSKCEINQAKVAKRHDGKILKGPNYQPPDIKGALENAKAETEAYGFGQDAWWPNPTVGLDTKLPTEDVADPEGFMHRLMQAARTLQYQARFVPPGRFLFDCPCDRTHEVRTQHGSRGGLRKDAQVECYCGKVYKIAFNADHTHADFRVEDLGGHKSD